MNFPYLKIPTNDPKRKWIVRPIIQVILIGPQKSVIVDALIDSGADKCLFNSELAKELGLILENGEAEYFGGIEGGKIKCFVHKIQLQILGLDKKIEVSAGFIENLKVSAILGQEGFFDGFKIKFEKDHNCIEISPSKT